MSKQKVLRTLMLVSILFVYGCTLYGSEIEQAMTMCAPHGGVKWVDATGRVKCMDGFSRAAA